jgi:cytochrome c oxidase subunit 3
MLWVGAAVLLGSSFTLELARRRGANWIDVTFFMGLGFVAIQTAALRELAGHGVFLQSSPHASFFYILTGLHGVHLLGGFGALVYAHLRPEKLGSCALYWHFLGGLWIYILLLLSLA